MDETLTEGLSPVELIGRATNEVEEVKSWIDNDVLAGDDAIQIHADRLANALRDLAAATSLIGVTAAEAV